MSAPPFSPSELAELVAYHRPHYVWAAVGDLVNLTVLAAILRFGIGPLYRVAERVAGRAYPLTERAREVPFVRVPILLLRRLWGGDGAGVALCFALLHFALMAALFLPLEIYFDYVLEHRHGLSKDTPWTFAADYLKQAAMGVGATSALVVGLYGLARRLRRWWLVLGVPAAALLVASTALDSHRARLYFAQGPLDAPALEAKISHLLARAHVDCGGVLVQRTSDASVKASAYFAGAGPTRKVVLSDTMLATFPDEEVLAVVAHEAAHVGERRWPGLLASALALVGFLFVVDRVLRRAAARRWFGAEAFADIRTLPAIALLWFALTLFAFPVSAAFARERERAADRFAVALTDAPETYRSMLLRLARQNKMDPSPPAWVVWRGQRHPPISERLESVGAGR